MSQDIRDKLNQELEALADDMDEFLVDLVKCLISVECADAKEVK